MIITTSEKTGREILAFIVKAVKLSDNVLREAVKGSINKANEPKQGKQSLDKLIKSSSTLENVDISKANIKDFERVAKKHGIDYALKKDTSASEPTFIVYFRGRDTEKVSKAFKEYAYQKTSEKKPSVIEKLSKNANEIAKNQQDKSKERVKDRGIIR